jgi:hypothetical protein
MKMSDAALSDGSTMEVNASPSNIRTVAALVLEREPALTLTGMLALSMSATAVV